ISSPVMHVPSCLANMIFARGLQTVLPHARNQRPHDIMAETLYSSRNSKSTVNIRLIHYPCQKKRHFPDKSCYKGIHAQCAATPAFYLRACAAASQVFSSCSVTTG